MLDENYKLTPNSIKNISYPSTINVFFVSDDLPLSLMVKWYEKFIKHHYEVKVRFRFYKK